MNKRVMSTKRDRTIHAVIHRADDCYVAECREVAVATQGRSIDQVVRNVRKAVTLHLDNENFEALGIAKHPRLRLIYDLPLDS